MNAIDPELVDYPFEVHGFFEEIFDPVKRKVLGCRKVEAKPLDRKLGVRGDKEYVITEPITLQSGHKTVTIKASPAKPLRVIGTLQVLCGRQIKKEKA